MQQPQRNRRGLLPHCTPWCIPTVYHSQQIVMSVQGKDLWCHTTSIKSSGLEVLRDRTLESSDKQRCTRKAKLLWVRHFQSTKSRGNLKTILKAKDLLQRWSMIKWALVCRHQLTCKSAATTLNGLNLTQIIQIQQSQTTTHKFQPPPKSSNRWNFTDWSMVNGVK